MRALAVALALFLFGCDPSLPEVDVPPAVEQVTPEEREAVLAVVQEEGLAGPEGTDGSLLRDWSREQFAEMLPNLDG